MLFGTAVALIIAAALFVPWQRMEQLTEQINERAARALCEDEIADHLAGIIPRRTAPIRFASTSAPATQPVTARLSAASTRPAARRIAPPRLVLLTASGTGVDLTSFEKRGIKYFEDHPEADFFSRTSRADDGPQPRYRYSRALRSDAGCLACHGIDAASGKPSTFEPGETDTPLIAAVSVTRPATSRIATSASAATLPTANSPAGNSPPATQPATAPVAAIIGLVTIDMPSQVDTNQLLLNRIFILAAGLLAGTLAVIVFYLITTRLILQPVHVLQETAEKVSKGDLNIRSHISTGDEFETLSRTFNIMLVNLKAGQDQLRSINKSLDLKLGQLAESNVALYESNRLKSEFLANVSHELRTPLNSILGFAELLKDGITPDARTARYVQNILLSGRNLLELINDLLDLAKIEAGRMEVRSEPLSLNDLFEGLTSIIKPLAEKQGVSVYPVVARDVPILHTDGPKLQQVLYNLLSNAIKFSASGGRIEMTAERNSEDRVKLSVIDHGQGIAPDKQQIIFEKFRQLDGSVTRQHSGTGLGLAISKELVSLLGGTIGVHSIPGEGATFWLLLPVKIAAGEQDVRQRMVMN